MTGVCPNCNTEFLMRAPNAVTCSPRCKQAMERKRRRLRSGAPAVPSRDGFAEICHRIVHNPTVVQLEHTAREYLVGFATKPSLFSGVIPLWEKPAGVAWFQGTDGRWMMEADGAAVAATMAATEAKPKDRPYSVMRDLLGLEAPEDTAAKALAAAPLSSGRWEMKDVVETTRFKEVAEEPAKPRTNAAFKALDEDEQ